MDLISTPSRRSLLLPALLPSKIAVARLKQPPPTPTKINEKQEIGFVPQNTKRQANLVALDLDEGAVGGGDAGGDACGLRVAPEIEVGNLVDA
jgi:hypothetical protein